MEFHCILVADEGEQAIAVEAGWDPKDILLPKVQTLEGRRFNSLTITWMALDKMVDTRDPYYVLDTIHRHVIRMSYQVPVRIASAHVGPPEKE